MGSPSSSSIMDRTSSRSVSNARRERPISPLILSVGQLMERGISRSATGPHSDIRGTQRRSRALARRPAVFPSVKSLKQFSLETPPGTNSVTLCRWNSSLGDAKGTLWAPGKAHVVEITMLGRYRVDVTIYFRILIMRIKTAVIEPTMGDRSADIFSRPPSVK